MPKRVFICHKATQKCTCCTKPDCELWCAAQGTAKLRSSVSGKQFPSYQEAGLLQCIGHRQIGILKQGCITQLSWENESGVFLLNDQSSNQKYDASSKSGFLSSALVTFGVEGLRRGGSGPYPPGSRSITLPHQLCEPKPSLAVIKCLLRKENRPWLRTTGPAEGRSLWKYCKAPMVALFTVLIWFWYHLLSYPNSKTRRKKHHLLTVTAFPQAHTPKVVR